MSDAKVRAPMVPLLIAAHVVAGLTVAAISCAPQAAAQQAAAPAAASEPDLPLAESDAQGLTLDQAMSDAEAHAFAVKIAREGTAEAEGRSGQTRAALGPKLSVEAKDAWISDTVNKLAGETLPNGTRIPDRVESAAAVITQPIVGVGALLLKLKADTLAAEAAQSDLAGSVADARLAGADAYLRALKAWRIYGFARASQTAIEKQRSDAAAMERQGRLSAVDVMRLDLALSEANTQLLQARSTLDIAALGLVETLGLPRDAKGPIVLHAPAHAAAPASTNAGADLPPLAPLIARAAGTRSDIVSANKRAEAAERYASAAKYDYLPSLNGFARYERDFTAPDIDFPPAFGGEHIDKEDYRDNLSVGVALNWTIWDWTSRGRRDDELAATARKARLAQEALVSRTHVEVAQAHAEARYSAQALDAARASVKLAEEVYRATELKFKNGLATTTDLITAERDQTRARATLANAEGDLDLAHLKLRRVSGDRVAP
jgi:outer membrane protein TolC